VKPFSARELLGRVEAHIRLRRARREAGESLRASEKRFRQLADAMPQIVWTALPDGCIDYFNERWRDLTGLAPDHPLAFDWQSRLHPDDVEDCREAYAACIREGRPYHMQHRFRDAAGSYRWFMARALPARDARNGV